MSDYILPQYVPSTLLLFHHCIGNTTQHIIRKSLLFLKLPLLTNKINYKNIKMSDLNACYFRLFHFQYQAPYKYSKFIQLPEQK